MPTIVDPDNLLDSKVDSSQNIFVDTALRTIKIRNNSAAPSGPSLDETGVTLQALYSFLKQEWKDDPKDKGLINYPFPLVAITPEQFEWRFGWTPADDSSRNLLRTAGWREFGIDDQTIKRQYIGVISLGNIDGEQTGTIGAADQDQAYYAFFDSANGISTAGPFTFTFPGAVNQAVNVYDSTAASDRRGDILRLFIRQEGKTYDQTDTTDIGISAGTTLPFNTQRFPLVEGNDLNATVSDATIQAAKLSTQKYSLQGDGSRIEVLGTSVASNTLYTTDLLNGPHNFGIKITNQNGAGAPDTPLTLQEIYSWVQYNLRQDSDVDRSAGLTINGKLTDELVEFVGTTLKTKRATNIEQSGALTGTIIDGVGASEINNVAFLDDGGTERNFPFAAGVTISFSQDILNDSAEAKVFPFYTYTREYTGTSVTIANTGPSATVTGQDSANFTLSGFTTTPLKRNQNVDGLDPATEADAFFRVNGATTSGNNTIWRIRTIKDSSTFSAYTYDDDPVPGNEVITGGTIRSHPINSPGSVLIDSSGSAVENAGTVATLAPANLNGDNEYTFTYAFDVNTQKDRRKIANTDTIAVTIRGLGLENGSWVEATGTITRTNNNPFSLISAVERNYSDPV